jgi:DnaJ-domain-containing protein 1
MGIFKKKQQEANAKTVKESNPSNGLYDAQLEKLIEMSLVDGVLTEKEKQVLFRKAESLGIDLDEFEMVLEARLQEEQKRQLSSLPTIRNLLDQLSNAEQEIRGTRTAALVGKVVNEVVNAATGGVVGAVGGLMSKGHKNLEKRIRAKKKRIILNFPTPTDKDSILEFLSYAIPMAKKKGNFFTEKFVANEEHNEFVSVWKTKCEQIITKVRISMNDDNQLLNTVEQYALELKIK